jgi:hypothetical protein
MSAARATLDLALVDLRELRGADLRPLLVQQDQRWRELFSWDFSVSSQAILNFLNNRTLHGFALVRSGVPVGYCYFVLDQNKALVGDIFLSDISPDPVAQRALLVRTLETAAAYPGISRVEGQLLGLAGELGPETIFHRELTIFPRWFMICDPLRAFQADRPEPGRYSFAFALTVHKSQGSEFDQIALILPESDIPLLTREMLYTAVTRSKRSVTIVGSPEVFKLGIKHTINRFSGMAEKLRKTSS